MDKDTFYNSSINVILIGYLILVMLGILIYEHTPFIGTLVMMLLVLLTFSLNLNIFNKSYLCIYILIFIVKLSLLVVHAKTRILPMGGLDWANYNMYALNILSNSKGIWQIVLNSSPELYAKFVALIYYVFGTYMELIYFTSYIMSLILVKYIYLTSFEITYNKRLSQFAALIYMIWPLAFVYSITFLRETPIQMFIGISFYHFIKYIKYKRFRNMFLAILTAGIASALHSGVIGVMLTYIIIFAICSSKKIDLVTSAPKLIIGIIIVSFTLASPIGDKVMSKFGGVTTVQQYLSSVDNNDYLATTNYASVRPNSIGQFVLQTPYRLIMFAIAPLPWQVRSLDTLFAFILDGIPTLFIVYRMIYYLLRYKPDNDTERIYKISFIMIVLSVYYICAWGTPNYGTAMRHRLKIFPIELIITFPYLMSIMEKIKETSKKKVSKVNEKYMLS